jgi:hypothetical protein
VAAVEPRHTNTVRLMRRNSRFQPWTTRSNVAAVWSLMNAAFPEQKAPKKSRHTKLSAKNKAKVRASARRGGRPYPNLVDNMYAAKKQRMEQKVEEESLKKIS